MKFTPQPVPLNASGIPAFLAREFKRISQLMGTEIQLPILSTEPSNAVDGMIVYADGTLWNPGSGAGFYGYEAGAWIKL